MIVDVSQLKAEAIKYPEPMKTMIFSLRDNLTTDEFPQEFLNLRKLARIIDEGGRKK